MKSFLPKNLEKLANLGDNLSAYVSSLILLKLGSQQREKESLIRSAITPYRVLSLISKSSVLPNKSLRLYLIHR